MLHLHDSINGQELKLSAILTTFIAEVTRYLFLIELAQHSHRYEAKGLYLEFLVLSLSPIKLLGFRL